MIKNDYFDLNLLSRYRGELMGLSIMLVVFYHFCNRGGTSLLDNGLRFLFSHGYVGVDIFFVVSGLGLTYSLIKNDCLKQYYLKRWIRIFPFFIFITIIECWVIRGESLELALLRSTTLGYWFGFPYIDWYVPALVAFYATYPLFYHFVIKSEKYQLAIIVSLFFLVISVMVSLFFQDKIDWRHFAMLYRVPDFILGCMIAMACNKGLKKNAVKIYLIISAIAGIFMLFLLYIVNLKYGWWLANLCFTPLYLVVLCNLFRKFDSYCVVKPFAFLGTFTLELYRISSSFERLLTDESCPEYHFLYVLIYVFVCIILSYIAHFLFNRINNLLYHKLSKFCF